MKIIWSPAALGDLDRLKAYISEHDPRAADRMYDAVFDAIEKLMQFPARGRPGQVPGTRELVVVGTPFVVPYRLESQRLEIIAVLHGARRWPPGDRRHRAAAPRCPRFALDCRRARPSPGRV